MNIAEYVITDSFLGTPYIDAEEFRDEPIPFHYVHGGFEGTDTRFSCYFPAKDVYRGRFIQYVYPGHNERTNDPDGKLDGFHGGAGFVGLAAELGAYAVESNDSATAADAGGKNSSVPGYRASAKSARVLQVPRSAALRSSAGLRLRLRRQRRRHCIGCLSRVTLPPAAGERGGIQPVAHATANGSARAEVKAGEPVVLEVAAELPPGAGTIIAVEWDFDGTGTWPYVHHGIDGTATTARVAVTHAYDHAGTYFPSVRITSHCDGDLTATYRRIENLARARVVVSAG